MSAQFDKAFEVVKWLATATPEQVAERILAAEREAFLWHVCSMPLSQQERDDVEQMADLIQRGGYQRSPR